MNPLWSALAILTAGRVRTRGTAAEATVYLTFDDGPDPDHTAKLLDLLSRHDAKATFFLLGRDVDRSPELVQRMLADGHAIGNHSMTHPRMRSLGLRAQWAEVDCADDVLKRFDGRRRHIFRPPNGRLTLGLIIACLWRRQSLVLWTIDSLDYKLSPEAVVRHLSSSRLVAGDVILFHDDGPCAGLALEVLLPNWKRAGLRFAALS